MGSGVLCGSEREIARLPSEMNRELWAVGLQVGGCWQAQGLVFPASPAMVPDGDSLCSADESAFGLFIFFLLTERFLEISIFSQRPIDYVSHILNHLFVVVVFVGY